MQSSCPPLNGPGLPAVDTWPVLCYACKRYYAAYIFYSRRARSWCCYLYDVRCHSCSLAAERGGDQGSIARKTACVVFVYLCIEAGMVRCQGMMARINMRRRLSNTRGCRFTRQACSAYLLSRAVCRDVIPDRGQSRIHSCIGFQHPIGDTDEPRSS